MTEIKSWKAERLRRQKIRDFKKSQKAFAQDINLWYERMKSAVLQTTVYNSILLNNRKAPYESKSNKS